MNCQDFQLLIDRHLEQDLSSEQDRVMLAHRDQCSACRERLRVAEALFAWSRQAPQPKPRPGFRAQALRAAARAHDTRPSLVQRHGFATGFATAATLFLGLWLVIAPSSNDSLSGAVSATAQVNADVVFAVNTTQNVKLVFASPRHLEGATISIMLPLDMELAGFPGKREVTWQTNLKPGQNLLRLPVVAKQSSQGELIARVEHDKKVKIYRIRLDARADQLSHGSKQGNVHRI